MDGSDNTVVAGWPSILFAYVNRLHFLTRIEVFSDHGIHGGLFFTFAPSGKIEHSMYCCYKANSIARFNVFRQAPHEYFDATLAIAEISSACRQSPSQSRTFDLSLWLLSNRPTFDKVVDAKRSRNALHADHCSCFAVVNGLKLMLQATSLYRSRMHDHLCQRCLSSGRSDMRSSCSFFVVMLCALQCGKIGIPQGYCRCNCDAETLCAWFRCLIANLHHLPQRSAICNHLAVTPRFSEFHTFVFVMHDEIGLDRGERPILCW